MRTRFQMVAMAALLLFTSSASAHLTVEATAPSGPFVRGETYTVPTTAYINCAVVGPVGHEAAPFPEYVDGDVLTLTVANAADYDWIEASTENFTIATTDCAPVMDPPPVSGVPLPAGLYIILESNVEFTFTGLAPAFIGPVTLQPGAIGETNEGGDFEIEIGYEPTFTAAPEQNAYLYEDGSGTLTIMLDLEMAANADSTFTFAVTSDLPDGVTAHIQETLQAAAPYLQGLESEMLQVPIHFSAGAVDHSAMEGMDHGDGTDAAEGTEHGAPEWTELEVTVAITLAADEDSLLVSDVQEVTFKVTRTAGDGHDDSDGHHDADSDEGFLEKVGLPGPGIALLLVAVAVIAATRRK